jgi:hypothetical protein
MEARRRNNMDWDKIVAEKSDFDDAMLSAKSTTEIMGCKVHDLREKFEFFRFTPTSVSAGNVGSINGRGC